MKKVLDIFLLFIIFLFIYYLQANFFIRFNIFGIKPNMFIILILLIGLFLKKKYGLVLGTVFGLILDFFISSKIGINAFAFAVLGLISSQADKRFSKDSRFIVMMMVIVSTLLAETIIYILQILACNININFIYFLKTLLVESIYNALIIIIIYPLFQALGKKIEQDFTKDKTFIKYF